jgi:iron complex outermembrane receptor protein
VINARIQLCAVTGLLLACPAVAETLVLEEVLVEARKISENSQTVPISMSVLTPEKIESLNAFDFTELDRIVPSLQLGANSPASATLKIRNVGPDFFALAFPAAVAVYVDGVPQAQPGSVFSTMLDIERIEVLNGPQGTLYGKNAPAGLISLYTVRPDMEGVSGYVTSSFSSWETSNNMAAINVPLIENKLALRVAGMYAESDGYMDNAVQGADISNGKEHRGVRAKLLWQPSADVDVLLSYYFADLYTEDNGEGFEGRVEDIRGQTDFTSQYDDYEVFKGVPSFSDTKVQDVTLNAQWSLESVNFTLLAQYQDLDIFQQQDNSNFRVVPPPELPRDFLEFNPVAYSFELRADGELGESFSYISGLIYSEDDTDTINFISQINIAGGANTETMGIYTNWTYRISEQWDVSLGGRYSDVTYDATVFGFIPGLGELNTAFEETYSDPSYSFKLRYYAAEDLLVYFAVDTAFRSGGINVLAPLAGQLADVFVAEPVSSNLTAISEDYFEFVQEDSQSFELGMKGTFLDQRFRWNLAAFLQTYDDHQFRTSPTDDAVGPLLSEPLSNLAVNVEEMEVFGIETEVDYLLDEHWSVFATAAYAKAEIQSYDKRMCEEGEAAPGTLICPGEKGQQLNDEPTFHLLSQLRYVTALADSSLELFGNITGEYYSKPYQRVDTPNIREILTLDMTLGIKESDGQWSIRVFCKNITDEVILFSEELETQPAATSGAVEFLGYSAGPRAPRSFGITGTFRF